MTRTITPRRSLPASRRQFHRLEQPSCLFGCQSGVKDGEVDLLLFRKVDADESKEAIEDAAQGSLLGRAHACANQMRPQRPQFLGEPTDLDMVATHRRRRLRCPYQPSHHRIQGSFFRLGMGEKVLRKKGSRRLRRHSGAATRSMLRRSRRLSFATAQCEGAVLCARLVRVGSHLVSPVHLRVHTARLPPYLSARPSP